MDTETRRNWGLILTPAGEAWSGRTRYAAAMYLYQIGEMPAEILEIYRICSRLDNEDPLERMRAYRLGADWISRLEAIKARRAE